jgi:hypothetical protein
MYKLFPAYYFSAAQRRLSFGFVARNGNSLRKLYINRHTRNFREAPSARVSS